MEQIAYCGFDCTQCPVYQATALADEDFSGQLAQKYTTDVHPLSQEDMHCTGCRQEDCQLSVLCRDCFIRACARKKGCSTCGTCPQYPCAYIKGNIPADSASRKRLDQIKNAL